MKILIAEDDMEINTLLSEFLASNTYETVSAYNGLDALKIIRDDPGISLVLLDLMLPYKSGDAVLEEARKISDVPVIVVSAKDTVRTKIELIRNGADDYITKPFDLDELLVRTEAVLRRSSSGRTGGYNIADSRKLTFNKLTIDCGKGIVTAGDKVLSLTSKEYAILELMLSNPERLFTKANIFESVWNEPYYSDDNTLKVHMSNLRNKIREALPGEDYIETVWGMGFKLKT